MLTSYSSIWDTFRSQLPFLTVIDTSAVVQMIQGILNIYKYQGWLPDCHMSLCKGFTQGGSNADNVMADAYLKIKSSEIDWNLAYEAVVKDAEEEPYGKSCNLSSDHTRKVLSLTPLRDWCCEGRGGLDSWHALGYIPVQDFDYKGFGTMTRSISRTLEYSYNDFCIAQIAFGLGDLDVVEKYQGRSENWVNLFREDQISKLPNSTNSTSFTGFFQPK